jgi:hypothetical protein
MSLSNGAQGDSAFSTQGSKILTIEDLSCGPISSSVILSNLNRHSGRSEEFWWKAMHISDNGPEIPVKNILLITIGADMKYVQPGF